MYPALVHSLWPRARAPPFSAFPAGKAMASYLFELTLDSPLATNRPPGKNLRRSNTQTGTGRQSPPSLKHPSSRGDDDKSHGMSSIEHVPVTRSASAAAAMAGRLTGTNGHHVSYRNGRLGSCHIISASCTHATATPRRAHIHVWNRCVGELQLIDLMVMWLLSERVLGKNCSTR
jgi:hypothetical protein